MLTPPRALAFASQHPLPPGPTRRCRRTSRDTIEAELFNLRTSRKGFVKLESSRLSTPQDDDDDESIIHECNRGRRWRRRRCNNEKTTLIEKIRKITRRAKVKEFRFFDRRNWWLNFEGNRSKVAVLDSPPRKQCSGPMSESVRTNTSKGLWFNHVPMVTEQKRLPSKLDRKLLDEFDKCEISDPPTNTQRKKRNSIKFSKPKEKVIVSIGDEMNGSKSDDAAQELTEVHVDTSDMVIAIALEGATDPIKPRYGGDGEVSNKWNRIKFWKPKESDIVSIGDKTNGSKSDDAAQELTEVHVDTSAMAIAIALEGATGPINPRYGDDGDASNKWNRIKFWKPKESDIVSIGSKANGSESDDAAQELTEVHVDTSDMAIAIALEGATGPIKPRYDDDGDPRKKWTPIKFWKPKEKVIVSIGEEMNGSKSNDVAQELTEVHVDTSAMSIASSEGTTDIKPRYDDDREAMNKQEKKNRIPVLATVATLSVSGLGVAAAIIFL